MPREALFATVLATLVIETLPSRGDCCEILQFLQFLEIEFTMIKDKSRLRSTRNKRLVGLLKKEMKLNRLTAMPFASFYFVDDQLIRIASGDPDYMVQRVLDHIRSGKAVQTLTPNDLERLTNNELKIGVRRGNRPPGGYSMGGGHHHHNNGGGGGLGGAAVAAMNGDDMKMSQAHLTPGELRVGAAAAAQAAAARALAGNMPLTRATSRLRGPSEASAESSSDQNDDMSDNDDNAASSSSASRATLVGTVAPPRGDIDADISHLMNGLNSSSSASRNAHGQQAAALRALGAPGMPPLMGNTAAPLLNSLSGSAPAGGASTAAPSQHSIAQSMFEQQMKMKLGGRGGGGTPPSLATAMAAGAGSAPPGAGNPSLNFHLHTHRLEMNQPAFSNVALRRRDAASSFESQQEQALRKIHERMGSDSMIIKTDRDSEPPIPDLSTMLGALTNPDSFSSAINNFGTQPFADLAIQSPSLSTLVSNAAATAVRSQQQRGQAMKDSPTSIAASQAAHDAATAAALQRFLPPAAPPSKFSTLPSALSSPPPGGAPSVHSPFHHSRSSSVSSSAGFSFGSPQFIKPQIPSPVPNSGVPPGAAVAAAALALRTQLGGGGGPPGADVVPPSSGSSRPGSAGSSTSQAAGSRPSSAGSNSELMRQASAFLVNDAVAPPSVSSNSRPGQGASSSSSAANKPRGTSSNTGDSQSDGTAAPGENLASELVSIMQS